MAIFNSKTSQRKPQFPQSAIDIDSSKKAWHLLTTVLSYKLRLNKRRKIIISTIIATLSLMISTQTVFFLFYKYQVLFGLGLIVYLFSIWALWEGMTKMKAIILLVLPVLFTLAVANFYFLLPVRWLTRLPLALTFGVIFYILLLSQNIFNVSSLRTIPLYRVAFTVTFLLTIVTAFLLFQILHALSLAFYLNALAVFLVANLLVLPILWSIEMDKITIKILIYTLVLSLITAEFALAFSFWPIPSNNLMWSVGVASALFIFLGITADLFRDRLNQNDLYLWIGCGTFIFLVIFFSSSWTG